ncbi:MAG: M48 family metallopeptidase [bacterium]|nr:M48 family metallopeptidase [bacterium]
MERIIELEDKRVEYTLRISRRTRGVRLCVASGGVFTVTASPRVRQSAIEEFIVKKAGWVLEKIKYFSKFPIRQAQGKRINRKKHFAEHKEKARLLVQERLEHFNQFYGLTWNKVAIRNQRSRWGSCSRKGNLNFNYKVVFLPPHLADYLVVHELCHLEELNHSSAFWSLVARTMPEHREMRKELRKNGMNLR